MQSEMLRRAGAPARSSRVEAMVSYFWRFAFAFWMGIATAEVRVERARRVAESGTEENIVIVVCGLNCLLDWIC